MDKNQREDTVDDMSWEKIGEVWEKIGEVVSTSNDVNISTSCPATEGKEREEREGEPNSQKKINDLDEGSERSPQRFDKATVNKTAFSSSTAAVYIMLMALVISALINVNLIFQVKHLKADLNRAISTNQFDIAEEGEVLLLNNCYFKAYAGECSMESMKTISNAINTIKESAEKELIDFSTSIHDVAVEVQRTLSTVSFLDILSNVSSSIADLADATQKGTQAAIDTISQTWTDLSEISNQEDFDNDIERDSTKASKELEWEIEWAKEVNQKRNEEWEREWEAMSKEERSKAWELQWKASAKEEFFKERAKELKKKMKTNRGSHSSKAAVQKKPKPSAQNLESYLSDIVTDVESELNDFSYQINENLNNAFHKTSQKLSEIVDVLFNLVSSD